MPIAATGFYYRDHDHRRVGASVEEPNDEGGETHYNSISFCVLALQYVRACNTVRHKPNVGTYDLHRGMPLVRSRSLHPNYGNPNGPTSVSAGGYMWNGRSASEWGGG